MPNYFALPITLPTWCQTITMFLFNTFLCNSSYVVMWHSLQSCEHLCALFRPPLHAPLPSKIGEVIMVLENVSHKFVIIQG